MHARMNICIMSACEFVQIFGFHELGFLNFYIILESHTEMWNPCPTKKIIKQRALLGYESVSITC